MWSSLGFSIKGSYLNFVLVLSILVTVKFVYFAAVTNNRIWVVLKITKYFIFHFNLVFKTYIWIFNDLRTFQFQFMWQICKLLWLLHGMQVVPAQTMLENADKDIDVILSPFSLTSFDLVTESNNIRMPQTDSLSRSSIWRIN